MISQHAVSADRVVHIVGALFTALNFPGAYPGYGHQHLGQHIDAIILAGKISVFLIALTVLPPAGLYASPPEAALAPQITAPVTSAGHGIAKGAVDKNLQPQTGRTSRRQLFDFIDAQLSGQNHPIDANLLPNDLQGRFKPSICKG